MALEGELWIDYTNHKGQRSWRHVLPSYIRHGVSKYHEGEQWFLLAMDFDKKETRCFALLCVHEFSKTKPDVK